jgi:hypothetical protein
MYNHNEPILCVGDQFDGIYQIGNGIVRVEELAADGTPVVLATMGSSEIFGEVRCGALIGAVLIVQALWLELRARFPLLQMRTVSTSMQWRKLTSKVCSKRTPALLENSTSFYA